MEAATEILISYNSKGSSMFWQECVGGPKNGSSKLACRAVTLQTRVHRTYLHRSEQQVGLESHKTAIKLYRTAQQNKTQECNGAHYVLAMPITGVTAVNDDPSCGNIWITGVCWRYL
jgi:hypothetical protein